MRIHRQRETFAYRIAADNPFDPGDNPRKKKDDPFGLDIPDVDQEKNLNALPGGGESAARYNQMAEAEENAGGERMQKMMVTPGAPSGGGRGGGGSNSSGGGGGTPDGSGILPNARPLYDTLMKNNPGADIGGYRVDNFHEHDSGALDFMTGDPNQANRVMQDAFAAGAPYVLWQQQQWNADGSRSPMEDRGDPRQNHYDHVHIAPIGR